MDGLVVRTILHPRENSAHCIPECFNDRRRALDGGAFYGDSWDAFLLGIRGAFTCVGRGRVFSTRLGEFGSGVARFEFSVKWIDNDEGQNGNSFVRFWERYTSMSYNVFRSYSNWTQDIEGAINSWLVTMADKTDRIKQSLARKMLTWVESFLNRVPSIFHFLPGTNGANATTLS